MNETPIFSTKMRGAQRLGEVFLLALLTLGSSAAAALQKEEAPPPPQAESLKEIPWPNLHGLEPAVAEQISTARATLEKASADSSLPAADRADGFGFMGQLFHAYGFVEAAQASYLNARTLAPEDGRWPHYLGVLAQGAGRLDEAVEYFLEAAKKYPRNIAALVRLGDIHLQRNQPAEARGYFLQAMTIDGHCAAASFGMGQASLSQKNYPDAVGLFHKTLALVPEATAVHYPLALAYRALNQLDEAKRHLELQGEVGVKAPDPLMDQLENLKTGEMVFLLQGRQAFNARDFQQAAALFRQAVEAAPESVRARVNLGAALGAAGAVEDAIEQFRKALELDPGNYTAQFNLGSLLRRSGRNQEAAAFLAKVVENYAEDSAARLELGLALRGMGDLEGALKQLSKVVELDPSSEDARLETVRILVFQRRYGEALKQLQDAHRLFPSDGRTSHALARLLAGSPDISLRNGEEALGVASAVFQAQPSIAHAVTLAMAYAEVGQCDKAFEIQTQAVEAAERNNQADLAESMKAAQSRYKAGPPCRPPGFESVG